MASRITVHVSAITLDDARHQQGANFLPSIRALIADGYTVEIQAAGNAVSFDDANKFTSWFLVDRLTALHRDMEARGDRGEDWRLARGLEDSIGACQAVQDQIAKAQSLLSKYNR